MIAARLVVMETGRSNADDDDNHCQPEPMNANNRVSSDLLTFSRTVLMQKLGMRSDLLRECVLIKGWLWCWRRAELWRGR